MTSRFSGDGWSANPELLGLLQGAIETPSRLLALINDDDVLALHGRDLSLAVDELYDLTQPLDKGAERVSSMSRCEATSGLGDLLVNGQPVASMVRREDWDKLTVNAVLVVEDHTCGLRSAGLLCCTRSVNVNMPGAAANSFTEGFLVGVSLLDELPVIYGGIEFRSESLPVRVSNRVTDARQAMRLKRVVPRDPVGAVAMAVTTHHLLAGRGLGAVERFDPPEPPDASHRACERCSLGNGVAVGGQAPFDLPYYRTEHPQIHVAGVEACVDIGIAKMVEALWARGFATYAGCQGGLDESQEGYVSFRTGTAMALANTLRWELLPLDDGLLIALLGDGIAVEVDDLAIRWQGNNAAAVVAAVIDALDARSR